MLQIQYTGELLFFGSAKLLDRCPVIRITNHRTHSVIKKMSLSVCRLQRSRRGSGIEAKCSIIEAVWQSFIWRSKAWKRTSLKGFCQEHFNAIALRKSPRFLDNRGMISKKALQVLISAYPAVTSAWYRNT